MTTPAPQRAAPARRSPVVAATLSFIWPGLGQWYAGRPRIAAVYGVPVLILAAIVLAGLAASGITGLALQLIEPSVAYTVLVLVLLLGVWRLLSIVDASAAVDRRNLFRGSSRQALSILIAIVIGTHGIAGFYAWKLYENTSQIFVGQSPEPTTPLPTGSLVPTDAEATPFATPETVDARITILLTGIDKTAERSHSLTDTMLVLSFEPTTGEAAMVSFPRDIAEFPLYTGGTYDGKINSLYTWAANHPEDFPDGPMPTLARELGFLLGIPIHYYAAVDIDGFKQMIDVVGGVTVNLDKPLNDRRYNWLDGTFGLYIPAGAQTLDGRTALAFVRSRTGVGDNDFTRAARQQVLLLALRQKLTDPAMLPRLPAILDIAGETVRTNFPPERISEMVELAALVDDASIARYVLRPPDYSVHPPTNSTGGIYILRLHLDAIRQLSVDLFGEDSDYWTGEFSPSGSPIPAAEGPLASPSS